VAPDAPLIAATESTVLAFGLKLHRDSSGIVSGIEGNGVPSWHQSGIRPTDVVVAIDGKPVNDVLHTPYGLDIASQAAVTTLTIQRDGEEISVEAKPPDVPTPRHRRS